MTTLITPETSEGERARPGIAARLLVPGFWAALSIVTMWLAVLFDGVYGGNMIFTGTDGSVANIPSAVVLGLFAVIGTSAIAKRAFDRRDAG